MRPGHAGLPRGLRSSGCGPLGLKPVDVWESPLVDVSVLVLWVSIVGDVQSEDGVDALPSIPNSGITNGIGLLQAEMSSER